MKKLRNFTEEELALLSLAGPIFTVSSETGSNACNLQCEVFEGQLYEIVVTKMKKHFEVDVLINEESTVIDKYPTFGIVLGLVRTLDSSLFNFIIESADEEDSKLTVEYLA
jgi:hypothetical protein